MKREIKTTEFLRTGKFGSVEINDSLETVIEKLGEPDGTHNPEVVKPKNGLVYSMYELLFSDNKLESIQNDHFNPEYPEMMEFDNEQIIINPEFLKADRMKYWDEIESILKNLSIDYSVIDYWGRKVIKTKGNVVIDFNDEEWSDEKEVWVKITGKENLELIGIRYFPYDD